jgi:RNA polymerase sigma-70 factor, ECF subfamily
LTKQTITAQLKPHNAARQAGHEAAFTQLLDEQKARLMRICTAYSTTRSDRDDLFQEIAMQIWRALPGFRGEAAITTWLYRIAVNTGLRFAQNQRKYTALSGEIQRSGGLSWLEESYTDDEYSVQHERINQLRCCIAELPEAERSVIVLYLEECSYKEIAEITGLSESNVGVKINRCKHKLLQCMTAKGDK